MNLLELLKSGKLTATEAITGKVVLIPFNRIRFACKNHIGPNKKPMPIAIVFSNPNDLEYICECGTTYQRIKDIIE